MSTCSHWSRTPYVILSMTVRMISAVQCTYSSSTGDQRVINQLTETRLSLALGMKSNCIFLVVDFTDSQLHSSQPSGGVASDDGICCSAPARSELSYSLSYSLFIYPTGPCEGLKPIIIDLATKGSPVGSAAVEVLVALSAPRELQLYKSILCRLIAVAEKFPAISTSLTS